MGIFASRVAEVPQLLDALWYHPEGMRITDLAAEVDRSPEAVSEALRAYYTADFAAHVADLVFRPEVIEFFGGSEEDDRTSTAPMVRLVAPSPGDELGVAYVSVSELARLYRAGRDQMILEPDNAVLASAIEKLHHSLLPGVGAGRSVGTAPPGDITKAIRKHRRIRVAYARAWKPGVRERVHTGRQAGGGRKPSGRAGRSERPRWRPAGGDWREVARLPRDASRSPPSLAPSGSAAGHTQWRPETGDPPGGRRR
jgi:hypothetical protein